MKDTRFKRFLYINYRRFFRTKRWRAQHITRHGYALLIFLILSLVMGLDITRVSTYQIFSILITITFLAIVTAKFFKINLEVTRQLPKFGSVDEPLSYYLNIKNNKNKEEHSLYYLDGFDEGIPSLEAFIHNKEPFEDKRNAWDRKLLYYRWLWLVRKEQHAKLKTIALPSLPPKQIKNIKMELTPLKRGVLNFQLSMISKPDLFSLFRGIKYLKNTDELLILPKRYSLNQNLLPQNISSSEEESLQQTSEHSGEDFFALRDYRSGDSLKDIHWKSWAKKGKPIVKEYQKQSFHKKALILDTESKTFDIFEFAVSLASSYVSPLNNKKPSIEKIIINQYTKNIENNQTNILTYLAKLERNQTAFHISDQDLKGITSTLLILNNLDSPKENFIKKLKELKIEMVILLIHDHEHQVNQELVDQYKIITLNASHDLEFECKKLQ